AGKRIGLVPTMGNLHEAHIALVKKAQSHCDVVVTSIFVNPLQFGLNEDWDKYPRTLAADSARLEAVGCDYLFCPDETEIYPNGMAAQTRVIDRKSTRLNSSHVKISYAVFCLKKTNR